MTRLTDDQLQSLLAVDNGLHNNGSSSLIDNPTDAVVRCIEEWLQWQEHDRPEMVNEFGDDLKFYSVPSWPTRGQMKAWVACLRDIDVSRASLITELMELRKALEPFAAEAENWHDTVPDEHRSLCTEPGNYYPHPGSETAFTVGDLRRAYRALNPKAPK